MKSGVGSLYWGGFFASFYYMLRFYLYKVKLSVSRYGARMEWEETVLEVERYISSYSYTVKRTERESEN